MTARRFTLRGRRDLSGVSGTGIVADGIQFPDGAVALRWRGNNPSTTGLADIYAMLAVHGHDGATSIDWIDTHPDAFDIDPECDYIDGAIWVH